MSIQKAIHSLRRLVSGIISPHWNPCIIFIFQIILAGNGIFWFVFNQPNSRSSSLFTLFQGLSKELMTETDAFSLINFPQNWIFFVFVCRGSTYKDNSIEGKGGSDWRRRCNGRMKLNNPVMMSFLCCSSQKRCLLNLSGIFVQDLFLQFSLHYWLQLVCGWISMAYPSSAMGFHLMNSQTLYYNFYFSIWNYLKELVALAKTFKVCLKKILFLTIFCMVIWTWPNNHDCAS